MENKEKGDLHTLLEESGVKKRQRASKNRGS
jgi:hypothetical protein